MRLGHSASNVSRLPARKVVRSYMALQLSSRSELFRVCPAHGVSTRLSTDGRRMKRGKKEYCSAASERLQ